MGIKLFYLVALACSFLMGGCSHDVTNGIVGTWQSDNLSFTFYPDNKFRQIDFSPRTTHQGTYRIIDGDKVELRYNRFKSIPVVHTASIVASQLELENGDGVSEFFDRVDDE